MIILFNFLTNHQARHSHCTILSSHQQHTEFRCLYILANTSSYSFFFFLSSNCHSGCEVRHTRAISKLSSANVAEQPLVKRAGWMRVGVLSWV